MYKCKRQVVTARIYDAQGNLLVEASNDCLVEVQDCPRDAMGFGTGEGYHLCKDICQQQGHAEVQAVNEALEQCIDLSNCFMEVEGHSYICEPCRIYMELNGLTEYAVIV